MNATNTGAPSISFALLGFRPSEIPGYRKKAQCDTGVPPVLSLVTGETPMSQRQAVVRGITPVQIQTIFSRSDVLRIDHKASFLYYFTSPNSSRSRSKRVS